MLRTDVVAPAVGRFGFREPVGASRSALGRHGPRRAARRPGVAKIKARTNGPGAHSVVEAIGTQESTMQAIGATRPGGTWRKGARCPEHLERASCC